MAGQLWKGIAFALSLFLTCFFGTLVFLTPLIPLALKCPTVGRRVMDAFLWMWFVFAAAVYELLLGVKIVVHGQPAPASDSVLILCNHRTRLDWLFLVSYQLRCGSLERYRISLKNQLKFLPGPGWAMQCAGYLFLKRDWKIDQDWISLSLKYFAQMGSKPQFLLFPEGTDFCENGLAKSRKFAEENNLPIYSCVLHPRTTGFIHFINEMKKNQILDSVLDVTVAYPKNVVHGEAGLCKGEAPQEVHFLVQNHLISQLPQQAEKLQTWCQDIWREKEDVLKRFHEEKSFAVNGASPAVSDEKERDVQRLFRCVVGFWMIFLCCVFYALVFYPLFKWYVLLSSITFVFIGRSYGGVDALIYGTCT